MNNRTRSKLKRLAKKVAKLQTSLEELQQEAADLAMEERDKADSMLDSNLAESEMAQMLEQAADEMESVDTEFDDALSALLNLEERLQDVATF